MMCLASKQDGIHCQGPMPPTAFSVPNRNKKLEVPRKRRRRKSQSVDPCSARGMGKNYQKPSYAGLSHCCSTIFMVPLVPGSLALHMS